MQEIIKQFLINNKLFSPSKKLIVGFSGGFDSMSLLHCLVELRKEVGFSLFAMHLNHNWRGEKALLEQKNCEDFCKKHKIELVVETLGDDLPKNETVARDLRYKFFFKCAKEKKADAIILAHNQDDVVETLLYRIFKGTGLVGLKGIEEKRFLDDVLIFRPMLNISREKIEDYVKNNALSVNDDDSNYDTIHKRNLIRQKIIPLISEISSSFKTSILNLSKVASDEIFISDKFLEQNSYFSNNALETLRFIDLELPIQRKLIYKLFEFYEIEPSFEKINEAVEFILKNKNSKSGKTFSLTKEYFLFVSFRNIEIIKIEISSKNQIKIEQEGEYEFQNSKFIFKKEVKKMCDFPNETDSRAFVDIKELKFPFTLRTRQEGDIIQPFGMSGKMKFKKYLINKNVPKHKRDDIIVLAKKNEILWAIGLGLSEKLKIKDNCSHYLEIRR